MKIIGGAEAYISNPDEYNYANYTNDQLENGAKEYDRWENSYNDDFFDVTSSKIISLTHFYDKEWGNRVQPPARRSERRYEHGQHQSQRSHRQDRE